MMLEDRGGLGSQALAKAANDLVAAANKDSTFAGTFTLYNAASPSVYADIDRLKAEKVGLTPTDVFSTLQLYLGSQYVNDFNYLGRTYQVFVQADEQFRRTTEDISPPSKSATPPGRWCRVGSVDELQGQVRALPCASLQPLSRRRDHGLGCARRCLGHGHGAHHRARP